MFLYVARLQTGPYVGKGSPGMDGIRDGQENPQERAFRGIHQGRSSAVPTHECDQPWKHPQVQYHWRTIQNDGKH